MMSLLVDEYIAWQDSFRVWYYDLQLKTNEKLIENVYVLLQKELV